MNKFTIDDFVVDTNQDKIQEALDIIKFVYQTNNFKYGSENEFFNLAVNLTDKYINKYQCKPLKDYHKQEYSTYVLLIFNNNKWYHIFTYCKSLRCFKFYVERFHLPNVKQRIKTFIIDNACEFKILTDKIHGNSDPSINKLDLFIEPLYKLIEQTR